MTLLAIVHNSERQAVGFVWNMADLGTVEELACNNNCTLTLLAELLADACIGIHALHQRGWIHRDLKPANLLVITDCTGQLRCKVADYDLAVEAGVHSGAARILCLPLGAAVCLPFGVCGHDPSCDEVLSITSNCQLCCSFGACIVAILFNEMKNPVKVINQIHASTSNHTEENLINTAVHVFDGKAPRCLIHKLLEESRSLTYNSAVRRTSCLSLAKLSGGIRAVVSQLD
ncbi:hypothetical protein VOLCADRAFT_93880 [Volvox carteri f. nagariensis]|uniref:Protein kinase domain-containing protein n=1 Tax=Volvox carteri f. nagariensis TaxID=3068 RepID=D8U3B2_VOLCA|nr:uncharacterized protein VOLCADRAFT_93880 [Volvox carteri f. nagariensis]EFJ45723.1 hypothetical protein VOLCADRAFT_93880 [Volvox carteri f. nagariensis]|eukprot:XP_002953124.1 hypothetical protein VOLCADRAFT_93880 [Volvox carteri f. nagariensis]